MRRLTNDASREDHEHWGGDGRIYFQSIGAGRAGVWSIRADGSGLEQLSVEFDGKVVAPNIASVAPAGDAALVWHEGHPHITRLENGKGRTPAIALPTMDGSREFEPIAWSPDGMWIVGGAAVEGRGYGEELILFGIKDGTYRNLASFENLVLDWDVMWMPDSREILLWRVGGSELTIVDRETGRLSPCGSIPEGFRDLALSPDGRSLYAIQWTLDADVWMIDYGAAK